MNTLQETMTDYGLGVHHIIYDGKIHRFCPQDGKSKTGWYVAFQDGNFESGAFGCWKSDIKENFCNLEKQNFTKEQKKQYAKQMARIARQTTLDIKRRNSISKQECIERWNKASVKNVNSHTYCKNKQIDALGARLDDKNNLLIPIYDNNINICNIQSINTKGFKLFAKGARIKNCYHPIGFENRRPPIIILCEGYATGTSIFLATHLPVVVCFNAGNIQEVATSICLKHNNAKFIITGDDDQFNTINIGRAKAQEAAKLIGAKAVFPRFQDLLSKPTDFNDLHCLEGLNTVNEQIMEVCDAL